jgi:hypothetical protein
VTGRQDPLIMKIVFVFLQMMEHMVNNCRTFWWREIEKSLCSIDGTSTCLAMLFLRA